MTAEQLFSVCGLLAFAGLHPFDRLDRRTAQRSSDD
jgi:hypothetical protein